jgi:hypothetical protein
MSNTADPKTGVGRVRIGRIDRKALRAASAQGKLNPPLAAGLVEPSDAVTGCGV